MGGAIGEETIKFAPNVRVGKLSSFRTVYIRLRNSSVFVTSQKVYFSPKTRHVVEIFLFQFVAYLLPTHAELN